MFAITAGLGFQMTFKNGVTLSIQFGPGNYCQNQNNSNAPFKAGRWESMDCEIAIIMPDGEFYTDDNFHQVEGWQDIDDVVKWIDFCRNMEVTAK